MPRLPVLTLCPWLCLLCGLAPALSLAAGSVREQEIAQCLPGEVSTWGDGVDRPALSTPLLLVYKHSGAPAWLSEPQVMQSLRKAAAAWLACADNAVMSWGAQSPLPTGAVLVQWNEQGSSGNFGLANLGQRTLSLGPAAFALLKQRNPRHDARETLQMVMAHEMGHLYGLMNHSRRCVDVMSYYHNGKGEKCYARDESQLHTVVEYRSALPTACDIQRCRSLNPSARPALASTRP